MKKILLSVFLLLTAFLHSAHPSKYVIGHWPGGMGAGLASTLDHLLYCETNNLVPVVYWDHGVYYNSDGFNGTKNEWGYYFNPVSHLEYNEEDEIHHFYTHSHGCTGFNYYHMSQEKRDVAYRLISKYITLNSVLQAKVDKFYNDHLRGRKTVAIHIRGTDKYTEDLPVPSEIMVAEALKYADENTQFFLATDEKRLLDEMCELLRTKKVIYYNCYRSEDGHALHLGNSPKRPGKPHVSQLGEDVIVEMWLMAKCDVLIHTSSNVSTVPLYINPEMKEVTLIGN